MTTEPATIAARARQALHQLSAAIAETPDPRHYVTEKFLSRVRLAALLAIPPAAVSAADDKSRATESTDALILTATDPADPATTYRFSLADPRFNDTPIRLLGRCPACGGEVPHQAIWSLAHLADADRPSTSRPTAPCPRPCAPPSDRRPSSATPVTAATAATPTDPHQPVPNHPCRRPMAAARERHNPP